ncbi:uncharacterized protein LOC127807862 isoform X3 [Diospyros lotus]|uniref:uncharacterized protein LOC127807862 isoform X3 n=1 Tax=Diospyros lotus TaxID=55363 RepID=UPI0022567BA3|nr:uncharacterized protein LOC127807862 isoform X3 [Diospyros lotus]
MLLKALKQWSRRGTGSSGEDVIFGKTTPIAQDNPQCSAACCTRRDCITSVGRSETGIVDQVGNISKVLHNETTRKGCLSKVTRIESSCIRTLWLDSYLTVTAEVTRTKLALCRS